MTLTGEDIGLLTTLGGVPLSILFAYLRAMRKEATDRAASIEKRVEAVESEVRAIAEKKADKQAWMRETINSAAKLDLVSQQIARLEGRYDSEFGVAAAVSKLADTLKSRAE